MKKPNKGSITISQALLASSSSHLATLANKLLQSSDPETIIYIFMPFSAIE
jgi:hypothetical protein